MNWIDENFKLKVANLLLFSIIYSEEGIIEYLDGILLLFMKNFIKIRILKMKNWKDLIIYYQVIIKVLIYIN